MLILHDWSLTFVYTLRAKTFLILTGFWTINNILHATHDTIWLHRIRKLQTIPGLYDTSLTLEITWHDHSFNLKQVSNESTVKFSVQSCLVHFNTQLLLICGEMFTYGLLIFQNPIALLKLLPWLISKHFCYSSCFFTSVRNGRHFLFFNVTLIYSLRLQTFHLYFYVQCAFVQI
jgi:hypothetical protein